MQRIGGFGIEVKHVFHTGHISAILLARELALAAWARLFAQRRFDVTFHKTPLDPVHRRFANSDMGSNVLVTRAGIGRKQDLGALDPRSIRLLVEPEALPILRSPHNQSAKSPVQSAVVK